MYGDDNDERQPADLDELLRATNDVLGAAKKISDAQEEIADALEAAMAVLGRASRRLRGPRRSGGDLLQDAIDFDGFPDTFPAEWTRGSS